MAAIDFSAAYRDSTRGSTIKALQQRRQALAEAAQLAAQPKQIDSPWQGAAQIAGAIGGGIKEGFAANEEKAARQRFAELLAGGLNPDEMGEATQLDPEIAMQYQTHEWNKELKTEEAAAREREALRARGWSVEDAARRVQETIDAEKRAAEREAGINTREGAETIAGEERAAGREEDKNTRENAEKIAEEERAAAAERAAKDAETAAGVKRIITGDEAVARGGLPNEQYEVSADGTTLTRVTPDVPENTQQLTGEEVKALIAQGVPLDPAKPYQRESTGKISEISGGGINLQLPGGELAARVGLGDDFLNNYDAIEQSVTSGDTAGAIDQPMSATLGWGKGGETYRQIQSGVDSLRRNLTGAGMNYSEIDEYAARYLPKLTDDATVQLNKVRQLKDHLVAIRDAVAAGRKLPELADEIRQRLNADKTAAPAAPAAAAEAPPSEEDIQETMRAMNMTRQQVLDALAKQKAGVQ